MTQPKKNRLLNNWIQSCIEYAEETEPPKLFKTWSAVAAISASLQRKCYINWGIGGKIYPNMYIILCGPSASRKGTAMKIVTPFLQDLETDDKIKLTPSACTREKLIQIMAGSLKVEDDERHCSVTVLASELTVFINNKSIGLIDDLNKYFDCEDKFEYATKGQGTDVVHNVFVSLFAATTPSHIQTDFPSLAITGGFTSRTVFVFGDTKYKTVPYPVDSPELRKLKDRLAFDLNTIYSLRGEFHMTKEFLKAYTEWYENSHKGHGLEEKDFGGYIGRRADHIRKLSMIFCASRGNSTRIELSDFLQAKGLLLETEKYMPFVFSGVGRCHGSQVIATFLSRIENAKGKWVKVSEIYKTHVFDVTWEDLLKYAEGIKTQTRYEFQINKEDLQLEFRLRKEFLE